MSKSQEIARICALLEGEYGRPECVPEHGPLDESVLTILSQHTNAANYRRAFANLKERFSSWEEARLAPVSGVEEAIRPGGLAAIKAARIQRLLSDLLAERGELSLDFLGEMSDEDARSYLMSFDGVGIKTASCVLMFSLARPVFPVDTHVHRITRKLGLIGKVSAEEAHHLLQEMIPDESVYSLHVNLVTHGRRVCRAGKPACDVCCLLEVCPGRCVFGE
ncbi:MAG: endonuclease III domain-containing protein [Armatimonadota bacterium]